MNSKALRLKPELLGDNFKANMFSHDCSGPLGQSDWQLLEGFEVVGSTVNHKSDTKSSTEDELIN